MVPTHLNSEEVVSIVRARSCDRQTYLYNRDHWEDAWHAADQTSAGDAALTPEAIQDFIDSMETARNRVLGRLALDGSDY